jgi:hypothetical protein
MADYWDEYSVAIPYDTKEEKGWLRHHLEEPVSSKSDKSFLAALKKIGEDPDESWFWGAYQFIEEDDKKFLHFYTDGSGGGLQDSVFLFVQHYLRKFRPTEAWAIRWGSVCSRSRLDGFSGGAAFVTAEKIETWTAADFVHEKAAEFNGKVNGNTE